MIKEAWAQDIVIKNDIRKDIGARMCRTWEQCILNEMGNHFGVWNNGTIRCELIFLKDHHCGDWLDERS